MSWQEEIGQRVSERGVQSTRSTGTDAIGVATCATVGCAATTGVGGDSTAIDEPAGTAAEGVVEDVDVAAFSFGAEERGNASRTDCGLVFLVCLSSAPTTAQPANNNNVRQNKRSAVFMMSP